MQTFHNDTLLKNSWFFIGRISHGGGGSSSGFGMSSSGGSGGNAWVCLHNIIYFINL